MVNENGKTLDDASLLQAERLRINRELRQLKLSKHSEATANRSTRRGLFLVQPSEAMSTRISGLEKQIRKLEVLTVVNRRLAQVNDREEFVRALQEICANLVGSEEIAIFEKTSARDMQLVAAWDGCYEDLSAIRLGEGIIAKVALLGEAYSRNESAAPIQGHERRLTACIPLKANGRIVGVLALFRLLPQKESLLEQDREILEFLENHIKNALLKGANGARHAW